VACCFPGTARRHDGCPDIFVSGYWASMPNIVREYLGDKEHAKRDRPRL